MPRTMGLKVIPVSPLLPVSAIPLAAWRFFPTDYNPSLTQQGSWRFLRIKYSGMGKYNFLVQNILGHQGAKSILECTGGFQPWMVGKKLMYCGLFFSLLPPVPNPPFSQDVFLSLLQ